MATVSIHEAQSLLPNLIEMARAGLEVTITTAEGEPLAKLEGLSKPERPTRQLGTMKGSVLYMAPDFDAPLEDFKEYME